MDTWLRSMERKLERGEFVCDTQLERAAHCSQYFADMLEARRQERITSQMRSLWEMTASYHYGDTQVGRFVTDSGVTVYNESRLETTEHNGQTIYWRHGGWDANGKIIWERVRQVVGVRRMNRDDMIEAIASLFGVNYNGKSWGNANGTVELLGITFHLRPKGKGSHRLKVECPACGKHFGPSKWRQHATHKHPNMVA